MRRRLETALAIAVTLALAACVAATPAVDSDYTICNTANCGDAVNIVITNE